MAMPRKKRKTTKRSATRVADHHGSAVRRDRQVTKPSTVSSHKAAFDQAHQDGMDALKRGDYDAFGEAVYRESKVIEAIGEAVYRESKVMDAVGATTKPAVTRRK